MESNLWLKVWQLVRLILIFLPLTDEFQGRSMACVAVGSVEFVLNIEWFLPTILGLAVEISV